MRAFLSVPGVWSGWVAFRFLTLLLLLKDHSPRGDVAYYFYGIFGTDRTFMTEYPHAGTWPTLALGLITGNRLQVFYMGFTIMSLVVDALFLALVLRRHQHNRRALWAGWFWVVFGTAAGHVFVWRLDLFPGIAVAGAAALLASRPNLASALLGFATTVKLWPGVLAAGLVGRFSKPGTWTRLASFAATIAALCALTVVTSGWQRLISPLAYQDKRGLQIESVPATLSMLRGHLHPGAYEVAYAPSKSFEITGPGVLEAQAISNFAMAAVVLFALAWALWHFFLGRWDPRATVALFTFVVLGLLAANKVFSPQYIVWLGPLLAVALRTPPVAYEEPVPGAADGIPDASRHERPARVLLWVLAGLCLLTAVIGSYVYPFGYDSLRALNPQDLLPVYMLALRNGLIVIMALVAMVWLALEVRLSRAVTGYIRNTPANARSHPVERA